MEANLDCIRGSCTSNKDLRTLRKKELYTTATQQDILPGTKNGEWKPTWTAFEEAALQTKLKREKINLTASKKYQTFFQEHIRWRRVLFETGGFPSEAQMEQSRLEKRRSQSLECQTSYYHSHSPNFKQKF